MLLRSAFLVGLLSAGPAFAHAVLLESQPAPDAIVPAGTARVVLRFNSRIDQARSRLVLRQGQTERPLRLAPGSAPDQLAANAAVAPGQYALRWQVLATDGHITRGEVPFTVGSP